MLVCLVTDLHIVPAEELLEVRLLTLRQSLAFCSMVVYLGDVLTMDVCGLTGSCVAYCELARHIVERVDRPFMFTLGNPRRRPRERRALEPPRDSECERSPRRPLRQ